MSAATSASPLERANQLYLRWSDGPELPLREEPVEIVASNQTESIIRSALALREGTKVFLIEEQHIEIGIIRSCRKDDDNFLLTINTDTRYSTSQFLSEADPGILAVDDFLTEEEEAKILESLDLAFQGPRGETLEIVRCLTASLVHWLTRIAFGTGALTASC